MTEAIAEKLEPEHAASTVVGYIDAFAAGRIYGWAWDPERPAAKIAIRFAVGGEPVAAVIANVAREDLRDSRIGDGAHAFEAVLPENVQPNEIRVLAVCPETGGTVELAPRPAAGAANTNTPGDIREVVQTLCRSHHAIHRNLQTVAAAVEDVRRVASGEEAAAKEAEQSAAKERASVLARLGTLEAAMVRVDGLVRDQAATIELLSRRAPDRVSRLLAGVAAILAGAALALALLH
jgi:hypothetical protein